MTSGANSNLILTVLNRFSYVLGYEARVFITHRAFMMTLVSIDKKSQYTEIKRLPQHGVNFSVISELGRMSIKAMTFNWDYDRVFSEVNRIELSKRYPRSIVLIAVSLSGAGFCNLFGGDWVNMIVVFVATLVGLFIRQETHKRQFNAYFCIYLAALASSLITASAWYYDIGFHPQLAIATAVLYLIPGVPLINSFIDFIDGFIINGVVRFVNGLISIFSIAMALFLVMWLFNINVL